MASAFQKIIDAQRTLSSAAGRIASGDVTAGNRPLQQYWAWPTDPDGKPLPLDAEARASLVRMADGDGRAALTLAEEVWRAARGHALRRAMAARQ